MPFPASRPHSPIPCQLPPYLPGLSPLALARQVNHLPRPLHPPPAAAPFPGSPMRRRSSPSRRPPSIDCVLLPLHLRDSYALPRLIQEAREPHWGLAPARGRRGSGAALVTTIINPYEENKLGFYFRHKNADSCAARWEFLAAMRKSERLIRIIRTKILRSPKQELMRSGWSSSTLQTFYSSSRTPSAQHR